MRHAFRKDANHSPIKNVFSDCVPTHDSSAYGAPYDLIVIIRGELKLIEIKDGSKAKSSRKLTKREKEVRLKFSEHFHVIESEEEALGLMGAK